MLASADLYHFTDKSSNSNTKEPVDTGCDINGLLSYLGTLNAVRKCELGFALYYFTLPDWIARAINPKHRHISSIGAAKRVFQYQRVPSIRVETITCKFNRCTLWRASSASSCIDIESAWLFDRHRHWGSVRSRLRSRWSRHRQLSAHPCTPLARRWGEVLILVDGFEKQSNFSYSACAWLDFVPARVSEVPKIVLII